MDSRSRAPTTRSAVCGFTVRVWITTRAAARLPEPDRPPTRAGRPPGLRAGLLRAVAGRDGKALSIHDAIALAAVQLDLHAPAQA